MQMQHFLQIYCGFELNFNIGYKETSSLKLMLIQPLIEFYAIYKKGEDHWKLQNSWKIMRIASISKHHLSHFMQTDKNRRLPPATVKYSGCMALGSNNYILVWVLNYQPCVFQQITDFLKAKFLIVKIGIIYQWVTVRIHRNSVSLTRCLAQLDKGTSLASLIQMSQSIVHPT